jgi:adenylosuccinate synthase
MKKIRKNSRAFCGANWGDEGKGKIVDQVTDAKIFFRDNGGANAGHTIQLNDGQEIKLHHLPSGISKVSSTVILGKNMVIHPKELAYEIKEARSFFNEEIADIKIDENTLLCLDTHRAYEQVLKNRKNGCQGSTGRGIGPAYVDQLNRFPLTVKDLTNWNENKIKEHYRLYQDIIKGLGSDLSKAEVCFSDLKQKFIVGSEKEFLNNLFEQAEFLKPYVDDIYDLLKKNWEDESITFVFEKAQGVGLDMRWGVYPDVTTSNVCFDGFRASTYGIVDPQEIEWKIGVDKATYASSVGSRQLPTMMPEKEATLFREYGHEYGATTGRPRDIAYKDLVALRFYVKNGDINRLAMTHMDSVFPDMPVKICVEYRIDGKKVDYRPDQEFLNKVTPIYIELPTWDRTEIRKARCFNEMPKTAQDFVRFVEKEVGVPVSHITNGPKREQIIEV